MEFLTLFWFYQKINVAISLKHIHYFREYSDSKFSFRVGCWTQWARLRSLRYAVLLNIAKVWHSEIFKDIFFFNHFHFQFPSSLNSIITSHYLKFKCIWFKKWLTWFKLDFNYLHLHKPECMEEWNIFDYYSSNEIRKTKNEHLINVCQNFIGL